MEEKINQKKDKSCSINLSIKGNQKCLQIQRLKVMKSRIFWSRKNSDPSIEQIKGRLKQSTVNKVDEEREKSKKLKTKVNELVNKLSLPKIRDIKPAHSMYVEQKAVIKFKKQPQCNRISIDKFSPSKRKSMRDSSNIALNSYQKRCESEIQAFIFASSLSRDQKNCELKELAAQRTEKIEEGEHLPKQIVMYLTKYLR